MGITGLCNLKIPHYNIFLVVLIVQSWIKFFTWTDLEQYKNSLASYQDPDVSCCFWKTLSTLSILKARLMIYILINIVKFHAKKAFHVVLC